MRRLLIFLLCLSCFPNLKAENTEVSICYNYGCARQETVTFDESLMKRMKAWLFEALDAEAERDALARVVGELYREAGRQTPISTDRGGNIEDDSVDGRMDCIDHSTTTTRMLRMLETHNALRFHRVGEPVKRVRFLLMPHASAMIEEFPPLPGSASSRFAVDSWFYDNGEPALILPLPHWLNGGGPNV